MQITDYSRIPLPMRIKMKAYVQNHQPVGNFLQAIIANDLIDTVFRADDTNVEILPIYVSWFYNEAPSICWKSREAYARWISGGAK